MTNKEDIKTIKATTIYLDYQVVERNEIGEQYKHPVNTVAISYSQIPYLSTPSEHILEKMDEAYKRLRQELKEELERINDK